MVARQIRGPGARQQIDRSRTYRDTRPLAERIVEDVRSPLGGWLMLVAGGLAWFVPALSGALLVLMPLTTLWIVLRRDTMPLHLPRHCGLKDYNDLNPTDRSPRTANGILYLGTEARTRKQIWMTADAARQHAAMPGTTGSGKTTALVSLMANPLCHGSGFMLIDAKGDNTVYGDVLALARRFGLDDQVLVLNLLTASGTRDSNTFNPFGTGNADAIREMLVSQLGEATSNDANGVFRDRAVSLIGTVIPALVWMRDTHNVPINIDAIRYATELRWIGTLSRHRILLVRNPASNRPFEYRVPEIPDEVLWPLQAYLGELPGYDSSVEWNEQKENKPSEQHGYAKMYFSKVFTQLGVSLGHIFNARNADIIMRDVVLNRRILIVILPSLENSSDSLAGLGKIVVASQRGVMAQLLGARLHGDAGEVFKLKAGSGDAPFQTVFDEAAAYVTDGMDRMFAMGRGLNCMFWLSFQDLPGLTARIGERAFSLLGNANLTHALRLQDAMKTREWLEQQADKVEVTQATRYDRSGSGGYYAGQNAEIREVSRLPWSDLQGLIEGEAVTMFGGRLTHSKTFFAALNGRKGAIRRTQTVMLPVSTPDQTDTADGETLRVIAAIESGSFLCEDPAYRPTETDLALLAQLADPDSQDPKTLLDLVEQARSTLDGYHAPGVVSIGARPETERCLLAALLDWGRQSRPQSPEPPVRMTGTIDGALLGEYEALERRLPVGQGTPRQRAMAGLAHRQSLDHQVTAIQGLAGNEAAHLKATQALRNMLAP